MKLFFPILITVLLSVFFLSCSAKVERLVINDSSIRLYEIPKDWEDPIVRANSIEKKSIYLSGKKIFIDPGHGGVDRNNKSPNGFVVEADINLNVALYLMEYLQQAGAEVLMSRITDKTVALLDRPKLANNSGSEIFISIHHNSPGSRNNDWTNYTSTFYHSKEGNEDYNYASHNLARFVQRDLAYVMRNSGGLGSFDGTLSDFIIYPGDGFAVLREANMPAILVECSFFTNNNEEKRLQLEEFNQIQAWGIFRGIGKYYSSGIPIIQLLKEKSQLNKRKLSLVFELRDNFGIDEKSIIAKFNNVLMDYKFTPSDGILSFGLNNLDSGEYQVNIQCKNVNGNYSFPFKKTIIIN